MKFKEFIGIDISKLSFDVRIHSNQQKSVFKNNNPGFKEMMKCVNKNLSCGKDEMLFALEHTGIYSLPICIFLSENQYHFVLLPGLEIKRSMGIQRGKNDKIDSGRIAEYAYQKANKVVELQQLRAGVQSAEYARRQKAGIAFQVAKKVIEQNLKI